MKTVRLKIKDLFDGKDMLQMLSYSDYKAKIEEDIATMEYFIYVEVNDDDIEGGKE